MIKHSNVTAEDAQNAIQGANAEILAIVQNLQKEAGVSIAAMDVTAIRHEEPNHANTVESVDIRVHQMQSA